MSTRSPSQFKQLWYKWKALRLPWRRQRLVGADLAGNTFWEFRDNLNAGRLRRIMKHSQAKYGRGNVGYADVRISPQWHQWLRHTRDEAPTIQEQQYDISRQAMMKQLAAEADERWRSQPSYLDSPATQKPEPAIASAAGVGESTEQTEGRVLSGVEGNGEMSVSAEQPTQGPATKASRQKAKKVPAPWDTHRDRGAPSENFQPQTWTPGVAQRQR